VYAFLAPRGKYYSQAGKLGEIEQIYRAEAGIESAG
jgi:hypothetical protein